MTPVDVIRMQMAMAFGLLDMQQKMVSGAWQMALWWMPGATSSTPGAGNICAPSGRRRVRG
ncbi:hypothetical protein C0V75_10840 [Tabrizicola sp. TH137]|uniref:hypothetical protein n=1 Tax=Tabrizicola sp. TH137 TaxID=2067452 RepID=UPI000C7A9C11|nr:hypothetical protein [Tabrizicola sp. TH137]PLL12440.1 hypothetical protein C0V75_10840 [Tabrizicola sp. TH137]